MVLCPNPEEAEIDEKFYGTYWPVRTAEIV